MTSSRFIDVEFIRFLEFAVKQVESSLSSPPPSQLHLLLSLFAPMGEPVETVEKPLKVFDTGQFDSL